LKCNSYCFKSRHISTIDDKPDGYWEWYRADGTIKRSGYFEMGEPIGEWVTYDSKGEKYKTSNRDRIKMIG
jgi:antitoxin component YwqK of YwqJK toxin-antitoxin module